MGRSLREFVRAVTQVWWLLVTGLVFGAVGVADVLFSLQLPLPWRPLAIGCLVLAQFLAFHRVRLERDKRQEMDVALESIPPDPLVPMAFQLRVKVTNRAAGGTFAATGQWLNSDVPVNYGEWPVCWAKTEEEELRLNQGQFRDVRIGIMELNSEDRTFQFSAYRPSFQPDKYYSQIGPVQYGQDLLLRVSVWGRESDGSRTSDFSLGVSGETAQPFINAALHS